MTTGVWPFLSAAAEDKSIKALIADDHRLGAEALAAVLQLRLGGDFEIVGAVKELQLRLNGGAYDLVILDTRMPEPLSMPFVEKLLTRTGDAKLFLLFDEPRETFQTAALAAGVSGAAPKTMALDRFLAAVDLVLAGQKFGSVQPSTDREMGPQDAAPVSRHEQVILSLAARGYSDKEIAADTAFKISFVKDSFLKLRRRLNARDRTQAVMKAVDLGIIE